MFHFRYKTIKTIYFTRDNGPIHFRRCSVTKCRSVNITKAAQVSIFPPNDISKNYQRRTIRYNIGYVHHILWWFRYINTIHTFSEMFVNGEYEHRVIWSWFIIYYDKWKHILSEYIENMEEVCFFCTTAIAATVSSSAIPSRKSTATK